MVKRKKPGSPVRNAAWIAGLYCLAAGIWIVVSDKVLLLWGGTPLDLAFLQTFKGLGFVLITTLALFAILSHYLLRYDSHLHRYKAQRSEFNMLSQFRKSVIDNASIWINVLDRMGRVKVWNKAAEQISGYGRDEVLGNHHIWEWLYPDPVYRSSITSMAADILDRGIQVEGVETRIKTKSGKHKIMIWNSSRFLNERGEVAGSIAIGRDVTAQKRAEKALRESERQLATLMASIPGMAYRCLDDETWTMKFVSDGCMALTGYDPADLMDNREIEYISLIHDEDRKRVEQGIDQAVEANRPFALEYRIRRKDGELIWVWEQGQSILLDGELHLEGIIIDINDRKAMEQELAMLASHDPLTGLYNRRELEQQLNEELARAERYARPLSLLWIDVDHFKSINDRYGHLAGDEVLRQLSQLLQSSVRAVDYVARYGGEELVIVLPEVESDEAAEMAERLRGIVESARIILNDKRTASVTISIGVATFPTHGTRTEHLFTTADRAMYRAKQNGRNQVFLASQDRS
jgi:diguanylate cyclase (GGDEF)-like protein/PAS domain S-box-containing protein